MRLLQTCHETLIPLNSVSLLIPLLCYDKPPQPCRDQLHLLPSQVDPVDGSLEVEEEHLGQLPDLLRERVNPLLLACLEGLQLSEHQVEEGTGVLRVGLEVGRQALMEAVGEETAVGVQLDEHLGDGLGCLLDGFVLGAVCVKESTLNNCAAVVDFAELI